MAFPESVGMASTSHQFFLIIPKPLPSIFVIRNNLLNLTPELFRMIHMLPVAQLMDHHVVNDLLRSPHQYAVEIQIPLCAAASPAGLLIPYSDPSVGNSHDLCIFLLKIFEKIKKSACILFCTVVRYHLSLRTAQPNNECTASSVGRAPDS